MLHCSCFVFSNSPEKGIQICNLMIEIQSYLVSAVIGVKQITAHFLYGAIKIFYETSILKVISFQGNTPSCNVSSFTMNISRKKKVSCFGNVSELGNSKLAKIKPSCKCLVLNRHGDEFSDSSSILFTLNQIIWPLFTAGSIGYDSQALTYSNELEPFLRKSEKFQQCIIVQQIVTCDR
jgi:hypothetical protein